ncbi:MAG: methylenetetrahydrofolate--tRNA-(uracil(54)-C(5))-methyltransferase (FADH(2)-oxidizing) TrmFO [Clostridia bacterium]|nr:methylenetetrahydrofolate--tRNA-(uracil(54)-C(5))-methyltransferase (FADH(2)-oxidizing) TrmFO [Clostridia bacterium]
MEKRVLIIGAGLAGSEAAWQLAKRGVDVTLVEMRGIKTTPAHKTDLFSELVCSNSLGSDRLENASGLLKDEMRMLDSIILKAADSNRIPAGDALAVDRTNFSRQITDILSNNNNISITNKEMRQIPEDENVIIATGPLTSDSLVDNIIELTGEKCLYFFDAAAPVITRDSIDFEKAFWGSRYNRGDDYINCPMNEKEYEKFWTELVNAETAKLRDFEKPSVFEGCMPVEVMAKRGDKTLLFGPLKPVGFEYRFKDDKPPHAIVQLRRDNIEGTLFNMVGFQTNLKWGEQKRVFRLIPGLENAEFVRYGVMHRNTFIDSPRLLKPTMQMKTDDNIFFAGQLTGVEGYVESAASGLVAGINMYRFIHHKAPIIFPKETGIGALCGYITDPHLLDFQPMNINFGILPSPNKKIRDKKNRRIQVSRNSLFVLSEFINQLD